MDKTKSEVYLTMEKETLVKIIDNKRECIKTLKQRIDKAIERITWYTKQFDNFSDKDLITNRVIDIEILYELLDILKGEDNDTSSNNI